MQEDEIPVSGRNNYEIPEDSGAFPGEVPLKAKGSYNFADESAFTPDEKPIGGTGAYNLPSEEAPEDSGEEETGPLEKRLESKAWKSRTKALEELAGILRENPDAPFSAYLNPLVKFISDSHPGAQENGLDVLSVYIEKQPEMLLNQSESLTKALIEKGTTCAKAQVKQKAANILLDFYAIQKPSNEGFIAGMISALNNKNLKIQAAAIISVNSVMASYGAKAFSFKPFVGIIEKFASVSNPQVRSEALNFYKECFKWVRDLILPNVDKLKKAQKDELTKSFEEITEPPVATRWIVGQKPKFEETKAGGKPQSVAIDIYEMADAKDIFNKYNERWADGVIAMEKWVEKKAALEELNNELNYPKLAEKSPLALTTMAKRLINDANVNVMLQTMRMIGLLAKGQRRYFDSYAKQFLGSFLQKFKDKKTLVIQEAHLGLDNLMFSLTIEQAMEEIKLALEDKTPSVKINTAQWLERVFMNLPDDQVAKAAKAIAVVLKKNTDDGTAEVRNSCFKILASLLNKCPEIINPIIKDLPAAKMKKLEESGSKSGGSIERQQAAEEEKDMPVPVRKERKSLTTVPAKPVAKKGLPPSAPKTPAKNGSEKPQEAEEDVGAAITPEDAESVIASLIPNETLEKLKESAWKEKQAGLQLLLEWVTANQSVASENNEAIMRFVKSTVKDWKENNVNVNKSAFDLFTFIASNCNLTKRAAYMALTSAALEKLSDTKLVDSYKSSIFAFCECVGPRFIVSQIIRNTNDCNKPKVVSECCITIGKVIGDFGVHTVNLKEVIDYTKAGLSQSNPVIKKAAQTLTVIIYSHIGDKILPFISDIKEALLKALQEEFSKTEIIQHASYKTIKGEEESKVDPKKMLDSVFPRTNISGQITPAILKKLGDANWKIRKEGLEAVEAVIDQSGMRILPTGLEVLIKALKARLSDPNKSIVRQTLGLISKLAIALNTEAGGVSRMLIPDVIANLSDKNNLLRQDALATVDKWSQEVSPESIINLSAQPLMQDNPELRTELLTWLLGHKENLIKCDLKPMVPSVLACLQDRTAGIRNLAEALFAEIIGQVGFEAFQPFLKDIKPAVMTSLSMIFDKYRNTNLSSLDMSDDNMLSSRLSRPPTSSSSGSRSNSKGSSRGKPTNIRASSESDLLKLSKKIPKLQAAEQQSQEISVITGGNKDKRLDYDSKHRWSVEELRQDYIDKLREAMKICFSNDLFSLLFSTDFKKQIESITHLSNLVSSQRSEITEVLDLIFKFIWYKLQEANNPQIYKALLEFNEKLFAVLQEENYQLNDNEAGLILPILCEKSGHNNAMFRQMIRGVIHSTCKIYPSEKVFLMVLQGLSSKNARSKVECLDELTSLIQEFGMGIAQPRDIRALAKFVNSPDNNVRTSAVNTIGEAFKSTGDKLWNLIGEVPDKVKDLLEQRFKTITGSVLGTTQKPKKKDEEGSSKLNTPRGSTRMQLKFEDSKDEIPVFTEAEEVKEIPAKKEIPALVIEKPVIQAPVIEKPKPEIVTPKVNREEERKITALETLITNNDESVNESLLYEPTRFEENLSELDKHIETLRSGDMSSRVDALVAINDLILNNLELHKEEFQKKSNSLIDALVKVIISTFDRPIEEVPLRFAKYFLNVVHKVCCTKLIMREVSENSLFALTEQILKRLLIEELDKLGDKGEGEVMLKTLNGTMLRVLEHCRPTRIFVVLIKLLTKYINDLGLPKMAGLVIRCLLKLTKILNTLIHQLEVDRVLIAMHEYLIEHKISNAAASGDEMGTKTIKTIINELVKLQGENIWESYEPIRSLSKPDSNIERWIQTLLSPNNNITSITSPRLLKSPHDPILASIFSRLSEVSAYNSAIQELFEYIEKNPKADLAPYLSQSPSSLYNKITEDLHRMRDNKNAEQQPQALESYNFQDFQNRLAMMKQRYGLASSNQPAQLSTTLTDLKAKVNTLLSKTSGQDEQADFINEMKERIQNLNRK